MKGKELRVKMEAAPSGNRKRLRRKKGTGFRGLCDLRP